MTHKPTNELNQNAIKVLETNWLLHLYENLSKGYQRFINKAIQINQTGEPFSLLDFQELKKNTFKQYVFHLREAKLVETVVTYGHAYYRVIGFRLDPYWEKLTAKTKGVSTSNADEEYEKQDNVYRFVEEYFEDLGEPAMHNIRLHFHSDYLYEQIELYSKTNPSDIEYIPQNKSYTIHPQFSWEKNISATITVTRKKTVQIFIKNTLRPIAVSESGIYDLISKLGEIRYYLTCIHQNIPPIHDWIFVRADFGQDCKKPLHQPFPESQFRHIPGALVRVYAKKWGNERILRFEQIPTLNKKMNLIEQEVKNKTLIKKLELSDIRSNIKITQQDHVKQDENPRIIEELESTNMENVRDHDGKKTLENTIQDITFADKQNIIHNEDTKCVFEETKEISDFANVLLNNRIVIGVRMTSRELLENPNWKKFIHDPKHAILLDSIGS